MLYFFFGKVSVGESWVSSGTRFFASPPSDSLHLLVSSSANYERNECFAGRS